MALLIYLITYLFTYLLIYLLTYSMVQSPSWKASRFAASQEIPHISRNPNVHYRIHKRPPPVSILGQLNPVHIPTSHLLEIHLNIILPSTPGSPKWSPSPMFPHQNPVYSSPLLSAIRAILPHGIPTIFSLVKFNTEDFTEICRCISFLVKFGTKIPKLYPKTCVNSGILNY